MIELNSIEQSGIRALLEARFEQPELYADKPVFIRQAAWHDGIQQTLVMATMRGDSCKSRVARRCFRLVPLADGTDYHEHLNAQRKGLTVGYVAYPIGQLSLVDCLNEVNKLIAANGSASPLIIYLPYKYQSVDLPGEQYIFNPDFEQWAKEWAESTIPDFIRGDGDKAGIIYRWYNYFNNPNRGCLCPDVWQFVGARLRMSVRIKLRVPFNKKLDYPLCKVAEFGEDFIRSAFEIEEVSAGRISCDVIDEFIKYLVQLWHSNITT